jgi:hypothetical protein
VTSLSALPYILIGNPDNRRVTLFQQALARQGRDPATVVPWSALIDSLEPLAALPHAEALLRIDSAGESFEVERGLLGLGYEEACALGVSTIEPAATAALPFDHGRIICPRQANLGLLRLLRRIEGLVVRRPGWRALSQPAALCELFDKRVTSRRYAAAGIPVPEALPDLERPDALREAMRALGWPVVFVKLACGSSASCLGVYHYSAGTEFLMTTIERTPQGRLYNTLKVRRVNARPGIDALLGFILGEGAQVERSVPKARLDGAFFDCRVLVVDGEAAFTVVRQSRHPITNLHLGGWRGDPAALRRAVGDAGLAEAEASCCAVARLHGDPLQLGVDLLYEAGFAGHRVIEANAFGDLLPNLEREGLDVYAWQIERAGR